MSTSAVYQKCISAACGATFAVEEPHPACPACGDLLDVRYDWNRMRVPSSLREFEKRWATRNQPLDFSGVWRFRELLDFCPDPFKVTLGEGQTLCQRSDAVAVYAGMKPGGLFLQYEGMNPSGSFKDNGMTACFSHARMVGAKRVACASTGNTSASMALYAAASAMQAIVFIGSGRIAFGKLAQALDYGALTLQIAGDFDACMRQVKDVSGRLGLYLMNSVNPFRLEGQKTIMYRVLEALDWQIPDWIVVPGGNLGNSSAFGKAFMELKELGLIQRVPRIAIINSAGADTLDRLVNEKKLAFNAGRHDRQAILDDFAWQDRTNRKPHTIASAIEISRPVNAVKCLRALEVANGVVRSVPDIDILHAKAQIGRWGLGCEPASAAAVAGLKKLVAEGVIDPDARVVCILTGHVLKDPDATVGYHTGRFAPGKEVEGERPFANMPIQVADDIEAICRAIEEGGRGR